MRPQSVYILHPQERYLPGIGSWLQEAEHLFLQDPAVLNSWRVVRLPHNNGNAFDVQRVVVRVRNALGPVLVVRPVHGRSVQLLRERLHGTCPVLVADDIFESTDLWATLMRARELFLAGEPMLPRNFVVALLLMRKLDNEVAWGGKDKGYEYFDNLANGRGVDIRHRGIMPLIVNYLYTADLLIKKSSRARQKYALNPERRSQIYRIMETHSFPPHLQALLLEDGELESARLLDVIDKPRVVLVIPPGHRGVPYQCAEP